MNKSVHKVFPALGTVNSIDVPSCPDENIIKTAADRVRQIHRLFSAFDGSSDVSRINAAAEKGYVPVQPDTIYLLEQAAHFAEASDGAFDATIRPLVELWGFGGRPPSVIPGSRDIKRIKNSVCWTDVLIDKAAGAVKLRHKGQRIDLGGIAKGFAVDEVRRILSENAIKEAVINLGGSVAVIGHKKPVGIQHPDKPTGEIMGRVYLIDTCAVTSGSYEKFRTFGGRRYHHIIDPRTGYPAESDVLSVTLVGASAAALDALSTAFFVLGAQKGMQLASSSGAEAIVVDTGRNVYVSENLKENFKLIHNEV